MLELRPERSSEEKKKKTGRAFQVDGTVHANTWKIREFSTFRGLQAAQEGLRCQGMDEGGERRPPSGRGKRVAM